ncbi:hypothetical protein N0V93_003224 [Gnomoniopsis smithogilvyi]|uniref:PPPDE domain-containing protein n=1 Tax=Gnomoniopsis smithogilvyi TaxID=1191159 RepID=A0A9W8YWP9_9PEZI|nr:hypothetical protein N0V93_003224 [Gnomoniopsis smithogilvyi]
MDFIRRHTTVCEAPAADDEDSGRKSPGSQLGTLLKDNLLKGKLMVTKELGLGKTPNVIPQDEVKIDGEPRTVELGWHPVAGPAGKWFAEQTRLGKMITEEIHKSPDPTQHWAVLVGDYVHQLWMDEHLDVVYTNQQLNRDDWHTFEVGKTRFNDEALREASEMAIFNMREKRASYNLINNNCQNFAMNLLDKIRIGQHRQFATSFAVYQRAIGDGTIKDLFIESHPDEDPDDGIKPELEHHDTIQVAHQVMDENTTKLDNHHSFFHSC